MTFRPARVDVHLDVPEDKAEVRAWPSCLKDERLRPLFQRVQLQPPTGALDRSHLCQPEVEACHPATGMEARRADHQVEVELLQAKGPL